MALTEDQKYSTAALNLFVSEDIGVDCLFRCLLFFTEHNFYLSDCVSVVIYIGPIKSSMVCHVGCLISRPCENFR